MNYLQINGVKILTHHIVKLIKKAGAGNADEYSAIVVDTCGQSHCALVGSSSQVDAYIEALTKKLDLTDAGAGLEYHWLDVCSEITVPHNIAVPLDIAYDGQPIKTSEVVFSARNNAVAAVYDGKLFALSPGKTLITATRGSASATIEVSVEPADTTYTLQSSELPVGATENLVLCKGGIPLNNLPVVWKSYNPSKLTISEGCAQGVAAGDARISASISGREYLFKVKVVQPVSETSKRNKAAAAEDSAAVSKQKSSNKE